MIFSLKGRIHGSRDLDMYKDKVLSLNVISSQYITKPNDDRIYYRFEVAWDSSMHNSSLLNRVTQSKDWIYVTITSYIEIDNCLEPACITKDLCLIVYARDAKISMQRGLRSFLSSYTLNTKSNDSNKVTAVYNLKIKKAADMVAQTSPDMDRCSGRVIDRSSTYVRGEEMLLGWRPRSDSLIFEHQWELERISRLENVEKTKNFLLLKESLDSNIECNLKQSQNMIRSESHELLHTSYTDNQKHLIIKCLNLINYGRSVNKDEKKSTGNNSMSTSSSSGSESNQIRLVPNINIYSTNDQTQTSSPICDTKLSTDVVCSPIIAENKHLSRLVAFNSIKPSTSNAEISR